jgi:hypothetical protein
MKLLVTVIVTLFALASAQIGQNVGGQVRQCTCNDQYNGFREFKDFTTQCFDQCRIAPTSELSTLLDSPVKIYPCLDQKVDMLHKMFDCVNGRLIQADSCTAENVGTTGTMGTGSNVDAGVQRGIGQGVSNQDFRQLIVQFMDPMFDNIVSAMEVLDQNQQQKLARNVVGLGSCASNCLLDKIRQASRYFDISNGCNPRINQNQLQQHIQTCFSEMNLRNTIYKVCTCGVGVGANKLQQFCQQLNSVQFPQWAQSGQQQSDSMMQGFGDQQQQQFGQQQQQGRQIFGPRGQNLRVNLAIQQEPSIPQQGFGGSQGSTGFNQNYRSDSIGSTGFF